MCLILRFSFSLTSAGTAKRLGLFFSLGMTYDLSICVGFLSVCVDFFSTCMDLLPACTDCLPMCVWALSFVPALLAGLPKKKK